MAGLENNNNESGSLSDEVSSIYARLGIDRPSQNNPNPQSEASSNPIRQQNTSADLSGLDKLSEDDSASTTAPAQTTQNDGQELSQKLIIGSAAFALICALGVGAIIGAQLITPQDNDYTIDTTSPISTSTNPNANQESSDSRILYPDTSVNTHNADENAHNETSGPSQAIEGSSTATHVHNWEPAYTTEHIAQQSHTEHIDTTYKEVTALETVCNTCKEIITNNESDHVSSTGHTAYTTNIPVTQEVVDVEGHDITVIDSEAYDKQTLSGYKCSECEKTLSIDEAKTDGVWNSSDEQ